MKVKESGNGGVDINLSGDELAIAIDAYLVARRVHISGPRTITVNGGLCERAQVYVDPMGFVIRKGKKIGGKDESN